jgi:autotransporter-associated beta strand protein
MKQTPHRNVPSGRTATLRVALGALTLAAFAPLASAQLYWDPTFTKNSNTAGGTGTYTAVATNWWNGTADVAQASSNSLVFGGTGGGTVTLSAQLGVNGGMTIITSGYNFAGASAQIAPGAGGLKVNSGVSNTVFSFRYSKLQANQTWTNSDLITFSNSPIVIAGTAYTWTLTNESGGTTILSGLAAGGTSAGSAFNNVISGSANVTTAWLSASSSFQLPLRNTNQNATLTYSGTGTFTVNGNNTNFSSISSTTNVFATGMKVSSGTLALGNNNALGAFTDAGNTTASTTYLQLNGGALRSTIANLTLANKTLLTASSTIAGTNAITLSSVVTNSGGNWALTNNNTATTTLSGGVALAESDTARSLTIDGTGNTVISGAISNNTAGTATASSLIKAGAGTLTLSASNSYSGGTTVNAGTLVASNASALGSGTLSVQNAALTVVAGLTVTVGNGLTLGGNAVINLLDPSTSKLSNSGVVTVSGTGNSIVLTGSTFSYGGYNLIIGSSISGASSASISLTNSYFGNLAFGSSASVDGKSYTFTNSGTALQLVVASLNASLVWNTNTGNWNTTDTNWLNAGTPTTFSSGNNATFTNAADVTVDAGGITAGDITVSNPATTVVLGGGTLTGTSLTVQGGGTLTANNKLVLTATNGTVIVSGSTAALNASNSIAGPVSVNSGGKLQVGNAGALGASALTLSGGTLQAGASVNLTNSVILTNSGNAVDNAGNTVTLSGNVTGSGLTVTNSSTGGNVTLSGTNSYSGLTVSTGSGTVTAGSATALGATNGALTVNSGTVALGSYAFTNASLSLGNGTISGTGTLTAGSLSATNSGAAAINESLTGTGGLTKSGSGTLTLGAANSYTGTTTVSGGGLVLGSASSLGNATNNLTVLNAGSSVDLGGNSVTAGAVSVTAGGSLNNGSLTGSSFSLANASVGANLTGAGGVTFGAGTVTLGGSNNLTGLLTLNGGNLNISGGGTYGTSANRLVLTGNSTLTLSGGNTVFANAVYSSNAQSTAIIVTNGASATMTTGGFYTSSTNGNTTNILTVFGGSTLTSLTSTYLQAGGQGQFINNGGSVNLTALYFLNGNATATTGTNAFLQNSGTTTLSSGVIMSRGPADGVLNQLLVSGGSFSMGNNLSMGNGNNATNILNNVTSEVRVTGGSLVNSNYGIAFGSTASVGYVAFVTNLVTLAGGTTTLGYITNNYEANASVVSSSPTGYTNIISWNGGVLQAGRNMGAGFIPVMSNTALTIGSNGGTFDVNGYSNAISPVIDGSGGLNVTNSSVTNGVLTLTGNNTYTGATVVNGGTLNLSGSISGSSTLSIRNSGTLNYSAAGSQTVTSATGTGSVALNGTGTLTLNGSNSYSGGSAVTTGTLVAAGDGALGTGSVTISSGGTLQASGNQGNTLILGNNSGAITGSDVTYGGLANGSASSKSFTNLVSGTATFSGPVYLAESDTARTLTVTGSGNTVFNGSVANNSAGNTVGSSLTKTGSGTLTLAGNNTYTGTTTVSAGALNVTGLLGGGSYSGAIANNASLILAGSSAQSLDGVISGTGSLAKSGSGTLTLSATNTYTGTTTVSGGLLALTGSLDTNSAVTVQSGASLDIGASSQSLGDLTLSGGNIVGSGTVTARSYQLQSSSSVYASLSGTADVVIGPGTVSLYGSNNTYAGDTFLSADSSQLRLQSNSAMTFNLGTSGVNNRITGNTNASMILNGKFTFNLTSASSNTGDFWRIIDLGLVDGAYFNSSFTVASFSADPVLTATWSPSGNFWDSPTFDSGTKFYQFDTTQGLVTVEAIPEPSDLALVGVGTLLFVARIRSRKNRAS